VSAVKKALERVSLTLFREHLDHCVADAVLNEPDAGRAKLDEAATAIERLLRS